MMLLAGVIAIGLIAGTGVSAQDPASVKLDGYAEWKEPGIIIVDCQRVTADQSTKWHGKYSSVDAVPVGYEVRATCVRQPNGTVLARDIDVRPNGNALFESEVQQGTNELEGLWLKNHAAFEAWTKSEAFRAAHQRAGDNKPLYLGHPQFEGFEVVQTVGRGAK